MRSRSPRAALASGSPRRSWRMDAYGENDDMPWKLDPNAIEYANELRDIQPRPDEQAKAVAMDIYPLEHSLQELQRGWLFVRKHVKAVWNEVLKCGFKRSAVLGNPGIGKSFSAGYFLKLLFERNKLIIFEARQDGMVHAFVPPGRDGTNKHYVAYTLPADVWRVASCPALKDEETYYLIEPGNAEQARPIVAVAARTVTWPSLDPKHLGDWIKPAVAGKFYMGTYTLAELLAVRPYLRVENKVLTKADVKKGFRHFGGIIRHVFSPAAKQDDLHRKALRVLKDETLVKNIYEKDVEALGDQDREKPPTALFQLVPIEDLEEAGEFVQQKPKAFRPFADARVAILSAWGREALVNQYWKDLEAMLSRRTFATASTSGWLFEEAAHHTLAQGGNFRRRYLSGKVVVEDTLALKARTTEVVPGGLHALLATAQAHAVDHYCRPANPKMPVLDAIESGKDGELYQVTIDASHSLAKKALQSIVKKRKHVVLNWVLPPDLFETFKARKVPLGCKVEQRSLCVKPIRPAAARAPVSRRPASVLRRPASASARVLGRPAAELARGKA